MRKQVNISIGMRLFFATLILLCGCVAGKPEAGFILAGIVASLPTFKYSRWHRGILGEGFTDEQEKQIEKLLTKAGEKHKEVIKTEVEQAVSGVVKTADLEAKFLAMGLKDNVIKELTDAVTKQGEELRKYFERGQMAGKTVDEIVAEKADEIKKLATGDARIIKLDIPKVTKAPVLRTSFANNTAGVRIPGVGEIPFDMPIMRSLFRTASIGAGLNGTVRYFDQNAIVRGAASRAENAAAPESSIDWIERTINAEKIMDSIPVTKEAFNDIDFVRSEVDRLLNVNMSLKEDELLYSGDGVAPNIKGINIYAPSIQATLEAAPYIDTVEDANVYDLVAVLKVVIMNGRNSKYTPQIVLMNGADILKFKLLKSVADGHYILPPFISADGRLIDGITVIESSKVTAGTLTIGDFRFGTIYDAAGLTLEMGWINDQFVKDAMTIKATKRLCLLVRNVDLNAFGKLTSITRALAYLDPGVANPA